MLAILCNGISKTNKVLPLTLIDFLPQALFARPVMSRVKLLDDKHLFCYGSFIMPSSVAFAPSFYRAVTGAPATNDDLKFA